MTRVQFRRRVVDPCDPRHWFEHLGDGCWFEVRSGVLRRVSRSQVPAWAVKMGGEG